MKNDTAISHSSSMGPRQNKGFTLIELVIAMVIVAILAAIAVPSYSNYVRKSRRTEAKSVLLDLASLEERYYSTQNAYTATAADLGYAAFPATTASTYYSIAAPTVVAAVAPTTAAPAGSPATFSITATAVGDQVNDTACRTLTVTSSGAQSATDSASAVNSQTCWR